MAQYYIAQDYIPSEGPTLTRYWTTWDCMEIDFGKGITGQIWLFERLEDARVMLEWIELLGWCNSHCRNLRIVQLLDNCSLASQFNAPKHFLIGQLNND